MTIEQQHRFALEFLEKIPLNKFDSIIDIGAGEGLQSAWFHKHGKRVMAVDIRKPTATVPYILADAHDLPFPDNSIDAVWTHHAFEHLRDPLGALLEASRILKPGGYLFFTVPQIGETMSSGHINAYNMPLVILHLASCGFDCKDGKFGKFRSHLRAMVRKIDTPAMPQTNIIALNEAGRLPVSVSSMVSNHGRFDGKALNVCWLDGKQYR